MVLIVGYDDFVYCDVLFEVDGCVDVGYDFGGCGVGVCGVDVDVDCEVFFVGVQVCCY